MVEYRKNAHTVFELKYRVLWITENHHKLLRGLVAERGRDLILAGPFVRGSSVREVGIARGWSFPDDVHMPLSEPAHLSPAKLVKYIEGRASRRLQDEFPELK